ncbi:T9SS type A sorting domain-containing protein [bacterium]|nr:T9SS type A sorting domain-containing protein [bacterium]RQV93452.1 MAG: T9SS C-terminal target domain-containing protein [bacterium]
MGINKKKIIQLIFLFGALIFSHAVILASQPQVVTVSYFDSLNVLEIVFDQPVYNDSAHVIRDGITISGYILEKYESYSLTGGRLPGDPENPGLSETVRIVVTFNDQKGIERLGNVNANELRLILPAGRFINAQLEGNGPITQTDDMMIAYYPYVHKPTIENAMYDAGTNQLVIQFNKTVQTKDNVDFTKISLGDQETGSVIFSSAQEFIAQLLPSDSVIIDFTPLHQQSIESFNPASLGLTLEAYAFIDLIGNTNQSVADFPVNYTPETDPTEIDSAVYDAKSNTLIIYFDDGIVTNYKRYYYDSGRKRDETLEGINYKGIAIVDVLSDVSVPLTGYKSVSFRANENKLEMMVLPDDQILIETLQNTNALQLRVEKYTFLDENLNSVTAVTSADGMNVRYIAETEPDAPVIADAYYHAKENMLELRFGNITASTKGIDTTNVTTSWITLHNAAGDSVALSGGIVHGKKAGVPRFIRHIFIDILPEDELKIEKLTNSGNLFLTLKPLTFFFECYTKTGNGNHALTLASQKVVQYVTDSEYSEIVNIKNDFTNSELKIIFNRRIHYRSFDPTSIKFGGIQLTGGSISDTTVTMADTVRSVLSESWTLKYHYNLTLDLNAADQQKINNLGIATKTNLNVEIDENGYKNLDGVQNPALNISTGDLTSDGETIFAGYGRSFWDQSFEAFPTSDELIPASLMAAGDHCYIYVADEQWTATYEAGNTERPVITQAIVDSFLTAFEESTPINNAKGIYDICHETFGQEIDIDGDPRIVIFFTDLRDEYDQGRAARAADIPKAGVYLTRNELGAWLEPHSTETDMIYIDTEPIIRAGTALQAMAQYFTHMIFRGEDSDEEQWLIEGMSGLAPVLCGYDYTSHRFPAETPKLAANKSLIHWTGWDGGTPAIDVNEFYHTSLFFLYIYEQFGLNTIASIAADSANGLQSVGSALPSGSILEDVFDDYAIAGFLDVLDHPTYGDRFGFQTVDFGYPTLNSLTWITDNLSSSQVQWSFSFFKTKEKQAIDQIRFNGNDLTNMSLIFTTMEDNFLYQKATLDDLNEAVVDVSGLKVADILTCVTSKTTTGPTYSDFVFSKDFTPPGYVHLTVFQNPSVTRNLNIYAVSDEQIYKDVPSEGIEGPQITIQLNNQITELEVNPYFNNSDETMRSYLAMYSLNANGNYTISARGQDMGGNDFQTQTASISVMKFSVAEGGIITDSNNNVSLRVGAHSLTEESYLTIHKVEHVEYDELKNDVLSDWYRIGPENLQLKTPAQLTFKYESYEGEKQIAVFRHENGKWIMIGGKVNQKEGEITVSLDKLGEFIVMAGESQTETPEGQIPKAVNLLQNYPNPFNPSTMIQYSLPKMSHVVLEIYNTIGQRAAVLCDGVQDAGTYEIEWNAAGFATGIYFYVLSGRSQTDNEPFRKIRKMMLVQ